MPFWGDQFPSLIGGLTSEITYFFLVRRDSEFWDRISLSLPYTEPSIARGPKTEPVAPEFGTHLIILVPNAPGAEPIFGVRCRVGKQVRGWGCWLACRSVRVVPWGFRDRWLFEDHRRLAGRCR